MSMPFVSFLLFKGLESVWTIWRNSWAKARRSTHRQLCSDDICYYEAENACEGSGTKGSIVFASQKKKRNKHANWQMARNINVMCLKCLLAGYLLLSACSAPSHRKLRDSRCGTGARCDSLFLPVQPRVANWLQRLQFASHSKSP